MDSYSAACMGVLTATTGFALYGLCSAAREYLQRSVENYRTTLSILDLEVEDGKTPGEASKEVRDAATCDVFYLRCIDRPSMELAIRKFDRTHGMC